MMSKQAHVQRLRAEEGFTLIELVLGVAISSLSVVVIFAALSTASRVEVHTDHDSRALASLRAATQRLTKELRQSGKIYAGGHSTTRRIKFWVDYDRDGFQDLADRVTWEVGSVPGGLVGLKRWTDAAPVPEVWVEELVAEDAFVYNRLPPETTLVEISLKADAGEGHAAPRVVRTEVRLRNAPNN